MTTIPFVVNNSAAPPFQAIVTLDGASYSLTTAWSMYRKGWYYTLTDQNGNVIITAPLIGSPPNATIYLAPGLFTTSTLAYRSGTNNFEVGP
jgi:hypothetical protein